MSMLLPSGNTSPITASQPAHSRGPARPPQLSRDLPDPTLERRKLAAGLLAVPAAIAPRYLYDPAGCALFDAICELPEYYPTRTESAIFQRHHDQIVAAAGRGGQLVDLGAGECRKAAAWIRWLAPHRYVAVDIAEPALVEGLARIAAAHPALDLRGIVTDFGRGIDLELDPGKSTFFYPGSSIGNFAPDDALVLLQSVRRHCRLAPGSGLLIGVDTPKDARRVEAAYADAAGVTAAFNRNVLNHVNAILGTRFDPAAFEHIALYDASLGRVAMYLEARRRQEVVIAGIQRRFEAGERIHTENAYKYAPRDFATMLQRAGFAGVRCWQDDALDFAVFYAE
jgi:dimethylhistidine N-methyltransferase